MKILFNIIEKLTGIRIANSPNFPRILENSKWLLFDNIVRFGGGFLVTAWMARYLGPGQFGAFNYAFAFASFFTFLGTLGLNEIIVRNIIRIPSQRDDIIGTAFLLRILGGTIAFGFALALISFFSPSDTTTHWLVGILTAGIIFQSFDVIDFYFQSQLQSRYVVWARIVAFIFVSLFKIFLILKHASLIAFAWAWSLEFLLAGIGLVFVYRLRGFSLKIERFQNRIAQSLMRDSWPMILSGIAVMINMRIDQIMIRHMLGEREVGIYAAAAKVSEAWYLIGMIIISSTFPIIMNLKKESESLYRKKCRQLYKVLIIVGAVAFCATFLMAKPIIFLLYGQAYSQSSAVLSMHVLGVVFVYLGAASTYALVANGLQKYHIYRTVLGCAVSVVLNLILIPRFGLMGAVYSMLCSYCISVFSILFFKETKTIFWE